MGLSTAGEGIHRFTYKLVEDGRELKLSMIVPEGWTSGDRRTAIVWIHGGGWAGGNPDMFLPHGKRFAARGAVCFSVQYRLIARDGEPDNGHAVEDCVEDCKSAIRYVRAHAAELGVDPERIVAAGDSAGGHLASCLASVGDFDNPGENPAVSSRADAVINLNGITDMTIWGWDKTLRTDRDAADEAEERYLKLYERAKRLSPLFGIAAGQPPMLHIHGLLDTVVLPQQSVRMHETYLAAGNVSRLVLLDRSKHAFVLYDYTATLEEIERAILEIDDFLVDLNLLELRDQ